MAAIPLRDETLKEVKDKVVVITGSAHGIGLATVSLLYTHGAKVIHGDWDGKAGGLIDSSLSSSSSTSNPQNAQAQAQVLVQVPGGETTFVQTDVTDYASVLNLFDTAWKKYGRVDVAISNAGVQEIGSWFEKGLDLEGVRVKPPTKTIDVNLLGTLYFSRIAAVYLSQSPSPKDKSLLLLSSTAGFKETPGLFTYSASKHGVLGLLRSLRPYLPKTHGVRTNAICPWMTDTVMVKGIRDAWMENKLPVNMPEGVARVVVEVAVGAVPGAGTIGEEGGKEGGEGKGGRGRMKDEFEGEDEVVRFNGRAVFVEGGEGVGY
ncbi:hypothetical protein BKA61DRAFT_719889 [Leptodontidium sp. MPI-SDFR-AT-0119]|nr:hypothetical protein BKA61DRAFT_719889 [Leptodontidium sp. MPI-SDFR-AT-0119]